MKQKIDQLYLLLRREFILILIGVILCFFYLEILDAKESINTDPIVVVIDATSTRLIKKKNDPILETEKVHFFKFLITELYNYGPDSYDKKVGDATLFFSDKLWDETKGKINTWGKYIKETNLEQTTELEKIEEIDGRYKITASISRQTRLKKQDTKIEIDIVIKRVKRTRLNHFGIEIEELNETTL